MALITCLLAVLFSLFYFRTERTLYNESMAAMKDYASTQPGLIFFDRFGRIFETNEDKYSHLNMFVVEYYPSLKLISPTVFTPITSEQENFCFLLWKMP